MATPACNLSSNVTPDYELRRLAKTLVSDDASLHLGLSKLCSLQPDLRRVPSVQGLERVSPRGHFVPLLARTVGTRVTLRRRGDIRSLCLLDFPCLAARARHTVWCEPLTPSPRACTASQAARRALDPTRRATRADRRAARRF